MCPCDAWHMANGAYERHMSSERNRKVRGIKPRVNKFSGGEKEKKEKRKKRKGKRKERKEKK